ncbi:acyl-CoA dehydrogenase family protein [Salinibacterium sp. ZJ454]|uniref:acyl-CoA dehydrogenase family protein n=1 Tax=Salinibacterium sp. ZJ454 TaxID=2708339 RepID=UPI00141FAAFD|nr:acyl-CoA dehydrogenase family protein [Salinibacterium sp. ZJ454]
MITDPVIDENHLEIRAAVDDFVESSFTLDASRSAAGRNGTVVPDAVWEQMAELGWCGLGIPEAAGGEGLGVFVQCIVHRALASRLAPSPFLATSGFAAAVIDRLADPELGFPILRAIAEQGRQAALAQGGNQPWKPAEGAILAREADEGWRLDGNAAMVLDGMTAETLIVLATTADGSWMVFSADGEGVGVRRTPHLTIDVTRAFGDLEFVDAPAEALVSSALPVERIQSAIDSIAIRLAAEMIGAAHACMTLTLGYLKTREQFGRPIGSFQALKHRCADLALTLTVAQELVFAAADTADRGDNAGLSLAAPLALHRAAITSLRIAQEAIQMHGGSGFAEEVDAGLFYKRALVDSELLAAPADCAARLSFRRKEFGA